MRIWTFEGGYDNNFTYILTDGVSPDAAIVDAAVSLDQLQPTIESCGLQPRLLLITHTHGDHIAYAREYGHRFPEMEICLLGGRRNCSNRHELRDGDVLQLGGLTVLVLHTPGHYPDSVCYYTDNTLFTGDTLFVGRTGRTIGTPSDTRQLYRSVYRKILTLPDDTIIYPGHNYGDRPTITLAENRKISPLLRATDEDDFVKRMAEYERLRLNS